MRLAARVALVALLLLRARVAEDHAAASRRLEPTRAPAPPAALGRASRARAASVISELAREVRWAAELRRRRAGENATGGAIRQRANQTLAGLVFSEGATTIPRVAVERARRASRATNAVPRPNQCVVGAPPKRGKTDGARTVLRVGRLSKARARSRARALPLPLSLVSRRFASRARALSL